MIQLVKKIILSSQLKNKTKIINLGYVKKSKDFYQQIDCLLAPLFVGSGTRIKILESLSFARPVISTQIGAEGIQLRNPLLNLLSKQQSKNGQEWLRVIKQLSPFAPNPQDLQLLKEQLAEYTWQKQLTKSIPLL